MANRPPVRAPHKEAQCRATGAGSVARFALARALPLRGTLRKTHRNR
ncbi:hypothetical protein C7S16_1022 [Burkholderia thailandensis]|uniref:Uncharacterized protein n=1 Tax=Burkholderia thailandensis TaxID=57975 RepID=A0AAW9D2G7_BURTH|nr:hypothetical protein [Burkholderia thailandensis]